MGTLTDLLDDFRAASLARDADRLAALYAEDGVHEFPFVPPGAPARIEGRDAIRQLNVTAYEDLPFAYDEYRTIAVHDVDATTLVVEQEALGVNTTTGARFVLPNVAVIEVDDQGLIVRFRDYVNPLAVIDALGDVAQSFG